MTGEVWTQASEPAVVTAAAPVQAGFGERAALRIVQIGAIAVVVAVSMYNVFELDRFFVPKELVLHVAAFIAGAFAIRAISRARLTRVDTLLIVFLGLSAISAIFSTNHWLGLRALAISASGILLFWLGRAIREAGLLRPLLHALALAVVLVAITSLLQAYGIETNLFSENRSPGGTLGNRNFVAHVAAFGFPLLLLAALSARRRFTLAAIGVSITTASLVLTRSRAAWLAFAAVMLIVLFSVVVSPMLRRDGRTWRRLFVLLMFAAGGVGAALVIPNTLRWRSANPYLESIQRVADYQEGSGRGRLRQYEHSLLMALRHPILGVGPGNWPVVYPRFASRNDPSMSDSEPGMTFNPWPSSDWIAMIAERGFAAAIVLALAFFFIATSAMRQLRFAPDVEQSLYAAALLGSVAGAVIAGLFDAVLLLALPAFILWTVIGALWMPHFADIRRVWRMAVIGVVLISGIGAVRSAMQLASMGIYATRGDRASLERAATIDPGNFRAQMRLARIGRSRQRCEHARAAHGLFPSSSAAADASRGCE